MNSSVSGACVEFWTLLERFGQRDWTAGRVAIMLILPRIPVRRIITANVCNNYM